MPTNKIVNIFYNHDTRRVAIGFYDYQGKVKGIVFTIFSKELNSYEGGKLSIELHTAFDSYPYIIRIYFDPIDQTRGLVGFYALHDDEFQEMAIEYRDLICSKKKFKTFFNSIS